MGRASFLQSLERMSLSYASRFSSGALGFALLSVSCSEPDSTSSAPRTSPEPSSSSERDAAGISAEVAEESPSLLDGFFATTEELARAPEGTPLEGGVADICGCANGDAIVLWSRIGDGMDIYASRFDVAEREWSAGVRVNQDNGLEAQRPVIAVNAHCDAIALWEEADDQSTGRDSVTLVGASYSEGRWQAPEALVSVDAEHWLDGLEVGMTDAGDALISYRHASYADGGSAMYQTFSKSQGFGKPRQLSSGNVISSHAGVLPSGDALYVYTEQQADLPPQGRYVARPAAGVWNAATVLGDSYTLSRVIATGRRFFVSGKLGEKSVVAMQLPGGSIELAPLVAPSESLAAQGRTLFAYWVDKLEERGVLRASRYVAGKGFEAAVSVSGSADDISPVADFDFAVDNEGRALAIYVDRQTQRLIAKRLTTRGFAQAVILHEDALAPKLSAGPDGSMFVAWTTSVPWTVSVSRFVPR